jgi:hypothetical protein
MKQKLSPFSTQDSTGHSFEGSRNLDYFRGGTRNHNYCWDMNLKASEWSLEGSENLNTAGAGIG